MSTNVSMNDVIKNGRIFVTKMDGVDVTFEQHPTKALSVISISKPEDVKAVNPTFWKTRSKKFITMTLTPSIEDCVKHTALDEGKTRITLDVPRKMPLKKAILEATNSIAYERVDSLLRANLDAGGEAEVLVTKVVCSVPTFYYLNEDKKISTNALGVPRTGSTITLNLLSSDDMQMELRRALRNVKFVTPNTFGKEQLDPAFQAEMEGKDAAESE